MAATGTFFYKSAGLFYLLSAVATRWLQPRPKQISEFYQILLPNVYANTQLVVCRVAQCTVFYTFLYFRGRDRIGFV